MPNIHTSYAQTHFKRSYSRSRKNRIFCSLVENVYYIFSVHAHRLLETVDRTQKFSDLYRRVGLAVRSAVRYHSTLTCRKVLCRFERSFARFVPGRSLRLRFYLYPLPYYGVNHSFDRLSSAWIIYVVLLTDACFLFTVFVVLYLSKKYRL